MKFVIRIMIGMVIFNAVLLLFAGYFPSSTYQDSATDVVSEYSDYDSGVSFDSLVVGIFTNAQSWAVFIVLLAVGGLGGVLTGRNMPLYLGIAVVIGLCSMLYLGTIQIFVAVTRFPIVSGIFSLFTLVLGILILFSVVSMLTGRQDIE